MSWDFLKKYAQEEYEIRFHSSFNDIGFQTSDQWRDFVVLLTKPSNVKKFILPVGEYNSTDSLAFRAELMRDFNEGRDDKIYLGKGATVNFFSIPESDDKSFAGNVRFFRNYLRELDNQILSKL